MQPLFLLLAVAACLPRHSVAGRLFPGLVGLGGHAKYLREEMERMRGQYSHDSTRGAPSVTTNRLRGSATTAVPGDFQVDPPIEELAAEATNRAALHANVSMPPQAAQILLNTSAMQRGIEELAISRTAKESAQVNVKSALASQKEYLSMRAVMDTGKSWEKVKAKTIEARAAALKVRMYASRARMYANHAAKVAMASRHIVDEAVEKAREAAKEWIKHDAEQTAETTSAELSANLVASQTDKIAAAVAAAAEPCHLTLLRVQKFCAQTYATAKSTQDSMRQLMTKAQEVAHSAQELQISGRAMEAETTMALAHGLMIQAETMRQHGLIMYKQANDACSGAGYYESCEQQAAANAAGNQIINAPMKLPRS